MQRLGAIDALVRGFLNVRANWELLIAQTAAMFLLFLLAVGSLVPLVVALGLRLADAEGATLDDVLGWLEPGRWLTPGVLVSLVAGLLLGTLAIAVYSWFQAGIYGVLVAGDRQAGAGPGRPAALYRTFAWPDFQGWAGRGTWRFFGWYHVYLTIGVLVAALFFALLGGAVALGLRKGPLAGVGLGCGGALPLFFLGIFVTLVSQAAKSDLLREGSGAVASWRRGGRIVSSRIWAALLLLVLLIAGSIAVSMLLLPLQLLAGVGLRDQIFASAGVDLVFGFGQSILGSLLGLVYGAAWIALMRAELPDPA